MHRVMNWLLAAYSEANLQVLRKSRILAVALLIFTGITLPFGAIMLATGAIVVGGLLFAFSMLCMGLLALLKNGRFKAAGTAMLLTLFSVMFAAIKFDQYASIYECYVFGTLGTFLLVTSALVGVEMWQPLLLTGLDLGAIAALYVLDSLPAQGYAVTTLDVQSLVTSSIMVIMSGIFAAISVRLQNVLIQRAEGEARASKNQFETMDRAVRVAQDKTGVLSLRIRDSMQRTIESADALNEVLDEIRGCIAKLDSSLKESAAQNGMAIEYQETMSEAIDGYSQEALKASEMVKGMSAVSKDIGEAARTERASVEKLVAMATEGERKLAELKVSIDGISAKAGRIEELSGLIGDIAQRTNMLGMNASIEAAHAGAAGKGFAIVADQIRALSEEAEKNARTIGESLGETRHGIEGTVTANEGALAAFRLISKEIGGVAAMLGEFLGKVDEISSGAESVYSSVNGVYGMSVKTSGIVADSRERIVRSSSEIAEVAKAASSFSEEIERMTERFAMMRKEADAVRILGEENAEHVERIRRDLESIRG